MIKRSVSIRGHKTSISLEEPFWRALREMAERRGIPVAAVVREIDDERSRRMARRKGAATDAGGLSSAIRVAVLDAARAGRLSRPPR